MRLSEVERALIREAIAVVNELNSKLRTLREAGIACNIRESHRDIWLLDMKAIIRPEDYRE